MGEGGVSTTVGNISFGQQLRPLAERNLSEPELLALDFRRAKEIQSANENPALWKRLSEIEAKLDRVLELLAPK